jgi:hypothetical protein
MKKVMLVTLVLAVCGVLHNSVVAQERDRYLVTYVRSSTNTTLRSATVVTVVNQSTSRSCAVQVEWFPASNLNTPVCTIRNVRVDPGEARQFCSRPFGGNQPGSMTSCNDICIPPLIAQYQGTAIVSSTDVFECSLLGVEARVYYTTGTGNTDTAISAISNSKVVFAGEGNLGD